jgi:hypothetical protein
VWSLGIVLINMLFHRNPWKDPTEGDVNFDNFLRDPTGFFLAKFTGIGREVASYLANRVLCIDVDDRVTAREFGRWIKGLPEMIAGKKAVHALKVARIETQKAAYDKAMFVKSPLDKPDKERKASTSALTSTAPPSATSATTNFAPAPPMAPALSSLPPASLFAETPESLPTPDLDHDGDDLRSATTVDEQPTPVDTSASSSPETVDAETTPQGTVDLDDARSLSTHKRRKRGVRKGKAAQAALAAAQAGDKPSQEERDALLHELASASQSLARDLSKFSRPPELDITKMEEFPPLGTTPAQIAAQKKSKWKDMMKLSSGNPELAALRQRVAEREASSDGNWSAPAKLQGDVKKSTTAYGYRSTATYSSGISSTLSSFGPVSSATSSSGAVDEDDWRKPRERQVIEENRGKGMRDESLSRARKAAIAAAAITGNMEPMGSFGAKAAYPAKYGPLHGRNLVVSSLDHAGGVANGGPPNGGPPVHFRPLGQGSARPTKSKPLGHGSTVIPDETPASKNSPAKFTLDRPQAKVTVSTIAIPTNSSNSSTMADRIAGSSSTPRPGSSSIGSSSTITITPTPPITVGVVQSGAHDSPNRPKIKGQIQSLAKMLSGLKTKGKD